MSTAAPEPRNWFYLLLNIASVAFVVTALAYAVVPVLEEKAVAAENAAPPSPFRDALRRDGWIWLLVEAGLVDHPGRGQHGPRPLAAVEERMSATVASLAADLDAFRPPGLAAEWDNVGLLLGEPATAVDPRRSPA